MKQEERKIVLTTSDGKKIELPVDSTNSAGHLAFDKLNYEIRLTNKKRLVMS